MDNEIKMLETVIHDGQRYADGETRKVDAAMAQYFCQNGWAEDPTGAIETGERVEGHVKAEAAPVRSRSRRNR